ncbi:MAG: ABC transporter permease, partial [Bacteroidota bacterium]
MWKNNIKIAFRHFMKNKSAGIINLAGLTVGISCCLLIMLYVFNELNYENWNPYQEQIHRPYTDISFGETKMTMAVTDALVGPDSKRELPEVQAFCRLRVRGNSLMRRQGTDQQSFKELNVTYADSTFFEIFPLQLLEGTTQKALVRPNTIAISRTAAEKYFGSHQLALGQNLIRDDNVTYQITAVFEDIPVNTHFQTDFLIAMNGYEGVEN